MRKVKHIVVGGILLVLMAGAGQAQDRGWTLRAEMPTARAEVAAAVLDGQVYVVGGRDRKGQVLDRVERFDPATERWDAEVPPLRRARYNAAAVVLAGRLFVLGGRDRDGEVIDDVEAYDPGENRWRRVDDLEEAREGHAAVVHNGRLYVFGGSDGRENILSSIEVYDPQRDEWHASDLWRLDIGRVAMAAVDHRGAVYLFGGISRAGLLQPVQLLQTGGISLIVRPPMSFQARARLGAVSVGDSLFVLGGRGPDRPQQRPNILDDVTVYDPGRDRWRMAPSLRLARESFGVAAVAGRVYVFGGRDAFGEVTPTVERYDASTGTGVDTETPLAATGFALAQNHPNPFRDQTTIPYDVPPDAGEVVLDVFDVFGRRVAHLVEGRMAPGRHTARWDGRAEDGRAVASGVYVYRLRVGTYQAVRTLTVVR